MTLNGYYAFSLICLEDPHLSFCLLIVTDDDVNDSVPNDHGPPIGNGIWAIKWSRDR